MILGLLSCCGCTFGFNSVYWLLPSRDSSAAVLSFFGFYSAASESLWWAGWMTSLFRFNFEVILAAAVALALIGDGFR